MRISDWSSDVCSSDLGCGRSLRRLFERHANQRVEAGIGAQFRARSRDRRACFAGLEAEAGEGGDGVGEWAGGHREGGGAPGNAAERARLVLEFMRDSLRELWLDAVRAPEHPACAAGEPPLPVADFEPREIRKGSGEGQGWQAG